MQRGGNRAARDIVTKECSQIADKWQTERGSKSPDSGEALALWVFLFKISLRGSRSAKFVAMRRLRW